MKLNRLLTGMVVLCALTHVAPGVVTNTWEFDNPADYVFDPELIAVTNSRAELVLQADQLAKGEFFEYTNASSIVNLEFDEPGHVQLRGVPGTILSNGVFTSRIIDANPSVGNNWQQFHVAAAFADYVSDSDLTAYYKMDNDAWLDQITRSLGTAAGNVTFTSDAAVGTHAGRWFGALASYNGRVTMPRNPYLGGSGITVAMRLRLTTYPENGNVYRTAIGGFTSLSQQFLIRVGEGNINPLLNRNLICFATTSGGLISLSAAFPTNAYQFVIFTWDGLSADPELRKPRLYINGAFVTEGVATTGTLTHAGTVWLGNDPTPGQVNARGWLGEIDEMLVIKRGLTADEVFQLFEGQSDFFRPVRVKLRTGPDEGTLGGRNFVGPDATTNTSYAVGSSTIGQGPDVTATDRYLQYQVRLFSDKDQRQTPVFRGVRVLGSLNELRDQTFSDLQLGTLTSNTVLNPAVQLSPAVGLAKMPNGGYYTNGVYESHLFDSGDDLTQWSRLSWSSVPELPITLHGLLALWHLNNSWADSKPPFQNTVFDIPNAAFTNYAKMGAASATFNGTDNFVSVGDMGVVPVKSIEFWIKDGNTTDEIMSLVNGIDIRIVNQRVVVTGLAPGVPTVFVNGNPSSPALLPGWNHVVVNLGSLNGVIVSDLIVGQIPGVGFMHGDLDELAAYNRELNPGEVSQHYASGRREVGGLTGFQVSDASLTNFVGPGGQPGLYFSTSPEPSGNDLAGILPAQRRIRYRVVFEGDGLATPMVGNIQLVTSLPTVQSFSDDTAAELYEGTAVRGESRIYGDQFALEDMSICGPSPLVVGIGSQIFGLWHFDDSVWNPTVSAAAGIAGTASGNARPIFDARVGTRAGLFDGLGDYIRGLSTVSPMGTNDFSLSLWFKTTSGQSAPLMALNNPTLYAALRVFTDAPNSITGVVALAVNDGTGEKTVLSQRGFLYDNQWHHVVGVRNGGQILIYVDGRREGGKLVPGLGNCGSVSEFWVADTPSSTNGPYFRGQIDEVAVHGRGLTEREIGENYAGFSRTSTRGSLQSETLTRAEPSIWQTLAWVPMGPFSKPLSPTPGDPKLVGIWHLEEFSGLVSNAVTANGMHGTVVGGATFRAAGRFDRGLDFDAGAQQYVTVAHNALLEPVVESVTIEAWVNADLVNDRYIISKRNGGSGYALFLDANGLPVFWMGGASITGPVQLRAGKWTHVAGVYDGARLRLYVDGALQAQGAASGTLASGAALQFGRSHVPGSYFDGRLDELAVHTRVLSGEEVLDHYRAGVVTAKFQARSSTTNVFSGPFLGPGRSTNTYYVLSSGSTMTADIDTGTDFQYRGIFETEDFRFPPDTRGVSVYVSGYPVSNPTIYPTVTNGFSFPGHLIKYTHQRLLNPPNTDVRYQISGDSGETPNWFYYDTAPAARRWTQYSIGGGSAYEFQSSSVAEISTNIVSFYSQVYNKTGGLFRFRVFLHSLGSEQAAVDQVKLEASEGRITILAPDGIEVGEKAWLVGVPYDITWEHTTNVTGTAKLEYSSSGGAVFGPLSPPADLVPVTNRTYTWTTPGTVSTQSVIRITVNNDTTINDRSDQPFTLRHGMQIIEHNGGTNIWYLGETNIVRWRKSSNAAQAQIEFSPDGVFTGAQARITTSSVGNSTINTFAWVTPYNNPSFVSEAGRLCVTNPAPNLARHGDVSDDTFVLAGAVVVSPLAGQGVKKDANFDLQWVSAGMGPSVSVEVQTQPGGPWTLIDAAAPNVSGLNTYTWFPTNAPTGSARIRLQSLSDPRATGLSEAFGIAAIEIVSPIGQENQDFTELWLQNTTNNITWTSGSAGNFVNLYYSTDGGQSFTAIATNVPNINSDITIITNVFPWIVAPYPTDQARVRIEDVSQPTNLFDVSSFDFKIAGLRVTFPDLETDFLEARVESAIQWDHNDVGTECTVSFSDNGGVSWLTVLANGSLGDFQVLFTPTNPTLEGLVRITADNPAPFTNIVDVSDHEFSVRGIRVANPQQFAQYTIGTTNPVTFVIADTQDPDFRAQIFYAENGVDFDRDNPLNGSFSFVDGGVNTFNWNVEPSRRPSQTGRIRVEAGPASTPYFGESEDFVLRGVKFDAPVSGTIWAPGLHPIVWSAAGIANGASANIMLSLSGGAPGTYTLPVATNVFVDDLTAPWVVPLGLGPSTNARLRMVITSSPGGVFDTSYFADSDVFTLQGIRLLSPVATSRWDLGSTQTITWDSASGGNRMDLLYSANGGATFDPNPIAANVVSQNGTNSLVWTIDFARTPSTNAVVRVASRTFPGLMGDSAPFYVRGVKVIRPTGADIYASTDPTNLIQWVGVNNGGTGGVYTINFIKESQAPVTIASGVQQPRYNWAFPPTNAVSDDVLITISDGIHTGTSAVFRIVSQPTILVTAPAAGDFWEVGSTHDIQWSRGGGMVNDFTVYYVLAPYDITNTPLTVGAVAFDETNNVFSYTWQVPDNPGKGKIAVKHNSLSTVFDDSGEFFIVGKFEMLNPPGPFDVYALKPNTLVRWRTRGSVPFVDLYYSLTENHDDWTKINTTPIANINKPFNPGNVPDSWAISTYDWTVPNARVDAAAVRVQEALYTQEFAPTDVGPFDDSAEFSIYYYTILWDVYDAVNGTAFNSPTGRLDHLSVVDSSGWGLADASAVPPNRITHDYPWGTFNTEIYREGFFDASILFWSSENTTISVPGPRAWTQRVSMARSQITEEYHVLANFSYDPNNTNSGAKVFTINTWMERGGVILQDPASSTIKIYSADGSLIDTITSTTPRDTGVFWLEWDASGQPDGAIFFAKVEVSYSGSIYSSGLTFTLTIPISDAITGPLTELTAAISNNVIGPLVSTLTNVAALGSQLSDLQALTASGFTNLDYLARNTTNMLGEVRSDVKVLTNQVIGVIGPKMDLLTNAITTIGLPSLARILSRPEAVALGSTNTMLYKSLAGYPDGSVNMTVTPIDGGGSPATVALAQIVGGLYQVQYVADWGLGRYRVSVSDPQASDSIAMRLVGGDIYDLPVQLGDVSNKLDTIESQLINMAIASDVVTNQLLPMISLLSSNIANLSTNIGVDFEFIQDAVSQLTNDLATLDGLEEIGEQVARLTNSLASITNVADMVQTLTNALQGVSWDDVRKLNTGVDRLTNTFWEADWRTVMAIDSNVVRMTNAMFAADGMVFDLNVLTQKVQGIDFARMQAGVIDTTNRLAALSGLDAIALQIGQLSNSLNQISALTNIAPTIAALGTNLLPVNFQGMAANITNMQATLAALDGLSDIANQIGQLSNSLGQISAVTNLSGSMNLLTNLLLPINFARMAAEVTGITNTLGALEGLDAIAAQIGQLSNTLSTISGVTNLNGQVNSMYTNLQAVNLGRMASDLMFTTNRVANLPTQINLLSNQMAQATRDLSFVTNKLWQWDWSVITNIQSLVGKTYTNVQALGNLQDVAADLQELTNAIAQLAGITNLGADVSGLTNALQGINWADVTYIRGQVDVITNKLTALDGLAAINGSIDDLTNSVERLTALTNMSGQVNAIADAVVGVDFDSMTNDVRLILGQVNQIDWNDIAAMRFDLQFTTNILADLSGLDALTLAVNNLTNLTGDLAAVGLLGTQVNAIASALLGVNLAQMYQNTQITTQQLANLNLTVLTQIKSDVSNITNTLANSRLDLLPGIQTGVTSISNLLAGVDFTLLPSIKADTTQITNLSSSIDALVNVASDLNDLTNAMAQLAGITNLGAEVNNITNALQGINWADIDALGANMDVVTGRLNQMEILLTVPDQLLGISNQLGSLEGVTNFGEAFGTLSSNLSAVNWADIGALQSDVTSITNQLGELAGLQDVVDGLNALSNSIQAIAGITNIGAQVSDVTNVIAGLTNAIGDIDWADVLAIKVNVESLTNDLAGLDDALAGLQDLTNGLGGIGDLTNLESQLSVLTNQLGDADWDDIRDIQADVRDITNSLGGVATLSDQVDTLLVSVDALSVLTETFATADWNDITAIDQTLNNLSSSLEGLNGVDMTGFDPDSNARIEATLQGMATVNLVDEIEKLMGTVNDAAGDDTFFGQLSSMESRLISVGIDAKNAAQRAQGAKTKAGNAASAISSLQSDIEAGDLPLVNARVQEIQNTLREVGAELQQIPKDQDPSSLYAQVRQMADAVNQLAKSKGFDNLLNFEGKGAAEAGGGMDAALARDLDQKIQEVRAGMEFMKQLMDEMRYEPVVEPSFIGVE